MMHVYRYQLQSAVASRRLEKEKVSGISPCPHTTAREDAGILLRLIVVMLLAVGAVAVVLTFTK